MYLIVFQCILEICSWPPSTATLASIPRGCHVTVILVQHDGRLDAVVQNCGHLREGKVGLRRSRNLRIHCLTLFRLLCCLGLDGHRLHLATACHPSHKELHYMVGSVPCALVRWVGMSLMLGGGPTPRPPILCIFMYLLYYT